MNNVMAMTALAASLLVSTAAIAAPANLADALQPTSSLTLVKGGGGGGGLGGGGGHMGGGGGGHMGGGGGDHMGGGGRIGGDAGPHFSGGDHISGVGGPRGGVRFGANDHFDHGQGRYDHDHFDHGHGHVRFFPGDAFFYGGDYADYGYYGGDCGWLARQARATGSAYWWRRYNECLY